MLEKVKKKLKNYLAGALTYASWPWRILEMNSGDWQRNIEYDTSCVMAYHAVFACTTLISGDISKLAINTVREDKNGIWVKQKAGKAAVLENPNNYQNRIQFMEHWISSKLSRGNTYVLKGRNNAGDVIRLYILNPDYVLPLVTPSGEVYYQLGVDNLAGIQSGGIIVPASEIIHDRFNCLFHPLVGLSPIYASGLAAYQGLKIQENSAKFFKNMSRPSGILSAPGAITDETAGRLKTDWETNYAGDNIGKVAVLGDDLKYYPLSVNAEDAQMIEQLKMTAEIVCGTFHVPKYMVVGDPPSYNNIESLWQQYYSQCLQKLMEDAELCIDRGLGFEEGSGVEFDISGLIRMDSKTAIETRTKAVGGGLETPNEARKKLNLPPLPGGDTVYLQQQYYSMEALAKRDAKDDPFASGNKATDNPALLAPTDENEDEPSEEENNKQLHEMFGKAFSELRIA